MLHLIRDRSFLALTVTQFLGAFNDNAFKQVVLLLALSGALPWIQDQPWVGAWGQSLALAAFAAPFIVFGVLGGSLADRVSKRRVMVLANLAEVLVMALGAAAFAAERYELVIAVLFLMGAQSAFFGPAKNGSIPELVPARDLSRGNGLVQATSSLAIVLGTAVGSSLFGHLERDLLSAGGVFIAIALVGFLASLLLRPLPARAPERPIRANPLREARRQWGLVRGRRPLALSIVASAVFYLVGASLMLVINSYGSWQGLAPGEVGLLLTVVSLGIGAGALLAARFSGDRIESGLVPVGLLVLAAGVMAVPLEPASSAWLRGCLLVAGAGAGLFIVPIRALIQHLPEEDEVGSVLGLSEVVDFVGIFAAAGLVALLDGGLGLEPPAQMAALGGLTLVFAVGSTFYTAEFALRLVLAVVVRGVYRIRTLGEEHVPRRGGALLVANHLSYVDAFLVSAALGRPVRFMMYRPFFDLPLIGAFSRWMGAIPVASEDSREAKQASLEHAADLLARGELVCIFAEGRLSRTGAMGGFRGGLERIARRAGTPILPVALDGVWGSLFSFEGGRFFWKRPRHLTERVTVAVGEPLPADSPAWKVRLRVQEQVALARADAPGDLASRYLRSARRNARRLAVVDGSGKTLTHRELLQRALALRAVVRRRFRGEERVGVLLPPGAPAAAFQLALVLAGKVPVPLNYLLGAGGLAAPIRMAGLGTVVTSPRLLEALELPPPLPGEGTLDLAELAKEVTALDRLRVGLLSLLPGPLLARVVRTGLRPESPATILFSSGSTGLPKGVVLSHRNVLSNVDAMVRTLGIGPTDRVLGVLPFFHSFGHTGTLWAPLLAGAAAVFHERPTDARAIARQCREHGVTVSIATPTLYQAWMRRVSPEDLASLRLAICGAEKLRPALAEAFERRYRVSLLEGYGATELSPSVSVNLPTLPGADQGARRGTVGRPLPGVVVRVVDPETGEELPPGHDGSVQVTGPNVMHGYLDDPGRTGEVLRGGWYDTGDVGRLDRDGFLTLTDRRSRFAKIGGEMVPLGRVEEALSDALAACPGAAGVEPEELPRLAVTAIPDERKGERLVVLHTPLGFPAQELVEALRATELPALFRPREDAYLEVPSIPQLGTGKTDLAGLRSLALERLGAPA